MERIAPMSDFVPSLEDTLRSDVQPLSEPLATAVPAPRRPTAPLRIMGIPVTPLESYEHALACAERAVVERRQTLCIAINPEKVYRARRDARLRSVLNQVELTICDGVGVSVAAWVLHGRRIARCTGVDLFLRLVARAAERGWRVFLLGASEQANAVACQRLRERYPQLRIVGRHHGFFEDSRAVVRQINACRPDLLFVALGSPRQEFWLAEHRAQISAAFCMGVGGAFDVVSGRVRRAPRVCRQTGTEFLYRLLSDPRRLRRQVVLPLFALNVIWQAWGKVWPGRRGTIRH